MSFAGLRQIQGDKLDVGKQARGLSGSKGASIWLIAIAAGFCWLTKQVGDNGACERIEHMMIIWD
jgi:hypothetical protein